MGLNLVNLLIIVLILNPCICGCNFSSPAKLAKIPLLHVNVHTVTTWYSSCSLLLLPIGQDKGPKRTRRLAVGLELNVWGHLMAMGCGDGGNFKP